MPTLLRILILEDEPSDVELEIAVLAEAGYTCQWERVETRAEFLACLDTSDYDVILADYNLPMFDGLSALQLCLACGFDLPFILVSGVLGEEVAIESLKAGATDYVLKGRLSRLGPVVTRALQERKLRHEKRQAEQALRESEARYRTLYEDNPSMYFTVDTGG
ncbi:MAG: response regulator, partial [Nitrospira sp.]|nr:response regulator [Nitrospira sp.]